MKDKVAAGYQYLPECFSALPLYHFLHGDSEPFKGLEMTPASIIYKSEVFDEVLPKTYDEHTG